MLSYRRKQSAFTIVELLVVIVVIGILAAITIVSYSGIQRRTRSATLQSDLKNATTQLSIDYINGGDTYPEDIDHANNGQGLKYSPGTSFEYVATSDGYCISATTSYDATLKYHIQSSGGTIEDGSCGKALTLGAYHSCTIVTGGDAYCWGDNDNGQIGDNSSGTNRQPVPVYKAGALSGLTIRAISAGYYHTCAVASDGNAYCWGSNANGQIGDGTSGGNKIVPTPVSRSGALSGLTIKSIAAGDNHTCVIASDNNAYCWGLNGDGQLGDNTSGTSRLSPTPVYKSGALNGLTLKSISADLTHTCAVASDNNAYCWGNDSNGQIGVGTAGADKIAPTAVLRTGALNNLTVKSITTSDTSSCVIASDNNAYCWGGNGQGQIGDNTSGTDRPAPTSVYKLGSLNGLTVKSISGGLYHTCVTASDNNAYCWGNSTLGQVGDGGGTGIRVSPTPVSQTGALAGLSTRYNIEVGYSHSCVVASNDGIYCWGNNNHGQLGDKTYTNRTAPVAVLSLP